MSSLAHRVIRKLCSTVLQWVRVSVYRVLSRNNPAQDHALRCQPVLLMGNGEIRLGFCNLGVWQSPYFFNGHIYIESRLPSAVICIADGVWVNNNAVIIAERSRIDIGKNTLIGTEFTAYDSDFHDLDFDQRMDGTTKVAPIMIGENVFIGSRVTILKGVTIGNNSVISAGSVVTKSVPPNCVAGGNPAKVIGALNKLKFNSTDV